MGAGDVMATAPPELKRLRWRCRRGMRELDVLLCGYLERLSVTGAPPDQQLFERLLGESDMDLYDWLTRRCRAPDDEYAALVERILNAAREPAA